MNFAAIIAAILGGVQTAVQVAPIVIKTIEDAKPLIENIIGQLNGGAEMTADQRAALDAQIATLSAELQAPLDPE